MERRREGIRVKGDRRGGWHRGQKTRLLRKKVRGGGRMILLSLVRWGEQLIRRISYQGDEVSLTAKKNGGQEGKKRNPRGFAAWKTHKFQFSRGSASSDELYGLSAAPYIDFRPFRPSPTKAFPPFRRTNRGWRTGGSKKVINVWVIQGLRYEMFQVVRVYIRWRCIFFFCRCKLGLRIIW